jgi:hypothetical protein
LGRPVVYSRPTLRDRRVQVEIKNWVEIRAAPFCKSGT